MSVRVDSGKYTFELVPQQCRIRILHYGEPWHEQSAAFNALHAMMAELDAARVVLDAVRLLVADPDRNALDPWAHAQLCKALERHRALVDDRELPSEWAAP